MRLSRSFAARTSRVRLLFALLLIAALFALPATSPRSTTAAGTIQLTQNISDSTSNYSESPRIDAANGRLSAVWTERTGIETKYSGKLGFSSTPVGSSFGGATIRDTGSYSQYQWADVAMDPTNGDAHIVYSVASDVYYRRRTIQGNQSTTKIASSEFANAARIARAPNGELWVVWRNVDGSRIEYRHSSTNGNSWDTGGGDGVVTNEGGNSLSPDVIADLDNKAHVFWHKLGSGPNKGEIRYADWNGSDFDTGNVTNDSSAPLDADAAGVVDSTGVTHLMWRKQTSQAPAEQWQIFYARRPAGGSWGDFQSIATVSPNAGFAPSISADTANNLYVTFSEPQPGNSRRIVLYTRIGGVWERSAQLASKRFASRSSVVATTEGGSALANIVFQDENSGADAEIYYARISVGPAGPVAAPTITGDSTNQRSVSVSFAGVSGSPTQVRWRWGAAPTDAANDSNGWQTYVSPLSVSLPSSLSTSTCGEQTLYTQVRNSSATQPSAVSDSIIYDAAAQANVRVTNPYLNGLPKTFAPKTADTYTKATDGAYNGDERYTRIPQYFLSITNAGDCSGLASFSIPVSNASGSISNGSYENKLSLAQSSIPAPGEQTTVTVVVGDSVPNLTNFAKTLIYDPADTDPSSTVTNTLGLPELNGGSVSVDSANSIIRTLTFASVDVDDTTYGQFESLAAGKQFWGVWIANSRTAVNDPNTANLQWFPVRVPNPGASFTLSWNIFNGIAAGSRTTGTYHIYVKFLDGAGNATTGTLPAAQAQLSTGFAVPTIYLPQAAK